MVKDLFFSGIEVKDIDYNKERNLITVNLISDFFVKESYLKSKEEQIAQYFKNKLEIYLRMFYKEDFLKNAPITEFMPFFLEAINIQFPILKAMESGISVKPLENYHYEITTNDNFGYEKLNADKFTTKVSDFMKSRYNMDVKLELKLDDVKINIEEIKQQIEEENINLAKQIEHTPQVKEKKSKPSPSKNQVVQGEAISIADIKTEMEDVIVAGEVFKLEAKEIKTGSIIYDFAIADKEGAISCKKFGNKDEEPPVSKGQYIKIKGPVKYDTYKRELVISPNKIQEMPKFVKKDLYPEKRVELHAHTTMSVMDALTKPDDLVKRAAQYEHKAVAIADHAVVQAYPDAMDAAKKNNLKVIYGCEAYIVDDVEEHIKIRTDGNFNNTYVVFDIETTGFSSVHDAITEIGAVKVENGEITTTYSQLINPQRPIPQKIVELTGITDELVANEPTIDKVLPEFLEFCKGSVLVAHNSDFDTSFIRQKSKDLGLTYDFDAIDTLVLSRILLTHLRKHKLNTIAKELGVSLENHHRAVDDATATGEIFVKFIKILKEKNIENFLEVNDKIKNTDLSVIRPSNATILVKNYTGLKNLYKLVSISHTEYLYRQPIMPKSEINKLREGLIIMSSDDEGELFKAVRMGKNQSEIEKIAEFYDCIEIMPWENFLYLIEDGRDKLFDKKEEIFQINKTLVEIGEKLGKPVVATSNCHYLDKEENIYRKILKKSLKRRDENSNCHMYFRTTDEMMEEFSSYLGEEKALEVVVTNTNLIADQIEEIIPIPDGTFPPKIEGSDIELKEMCYKKAKKIYSDNLPEVVEKRLERELNSIISNGYAVMYIIAQKLVTKSIADGYLVGSRGSVGSSFAATMSDITEVNPLPPHYICPNCKNFEFVGTEKYGSGVDLPDKNCPKCNTPYKKDGFDIPFEVFMGFNGDKEPDIDLNFAGEYQPRAHKYTEELFGEGYVFRAGTIGKVAEKTAYGFVKKYEEETGVQFTQPFIDYLRIGCTDIKRTTGQHPGGVMIVPKYKDIYDFSPIQYPANDKKSGVLTTHFDYHSISGRILKLDILGHDGPSIIKQLEQLTGTIATEVPLDDKETMSIFKDTKALNCTLEEIDCKVGTLGIPEFGTAFVRQMLMDTKPTTFSELIRISGLSHGTNVWINNAQELVRNNVAVLKEVISTRDDILNYLISKGMDNSLAFKIMEIVRKNKVLSDDQIKAMEESGVPQWYIESCRKIEYLFPKAHAAAYVMMSFRIAYYKVHYKEAFYATYFTTKVDDFDIGLIGQGKQMVFDRMQELIMKGNEATTKEKGQITVLEVAYEMYQRGCKLGKVDLYKSQARKFGIAEDKTIIPPLMSVQGLGEVVANNIVTEAQKGEFISIEDFKNRTGCSKSVIEELKQAGCFENIQELNQISFNIF